MLIKKEIDTVRIEKEINTIVNSRFGFSESVVNQIEELPDCSYKRNERLY